MARKFVTDREIRFINGINRELIPHVSGQFVIYYAISEETHVHPVYGESPDKEFLPPVRVAARVDFTANPTVVTPGHADASTEIIVKIQPQELTERNLVPRIGDFLEYGQIFYEVSSIKNDQPIYGQINNKIDVELTCVASREGQFAAGGSTLEGIDNTNPVETRRARTLGDDL